MQEDFLHYIWKFGLFDKSNLRALAGETIEVLRPGEHNPDSGPDFFNAKLRIDGVELNGNIEIHINSSDWYRHRHETDRAYNSVILHVVLNSDAENHLLRPQAKTAAGDLLPELELKFRILPDVKKNYELLNGSSRSFPCAGMIGKVERELIDGWLEHMLIDRLEEKQADLEDLFESLNNDWKELFYQQLAKNFGFHTNSDTFYRLARSIPRKVLFAHMKDLLQVESLLFGQAGMLEEQFDDPYPQKLQNEYEKLRAKHELVPLKKESWKFLRMRPVNFPTVRIAQFAALVHGSSYLFSQEPDFFTSEYLEDLFTAHASAYWDTHYSFGASSARAKKKTIGKQARENILINTIAPLVFFYGKQHKDEALVKRAIDLLVSVSAEDNKIIREYAVAGYHPKNAIQSQGIIHLNRNYCRKSGCLKCSIGNKLLRD